MGNCSSMIHELSSHEQLEYSVIAYASGAPFGAKYNACVVQLKYDPDPGVLAGLTGKGDTPLAAMADLFNRADQVTRSE